MTINVNEEAAKLTKALSDSGKIIEAGFVGLRMTAMAKDAPEDQVREMRMAFFAGAQHLFGSIMTFLDSGEDATDRDLRRMSLIEAELQDFIKQFAKDHLKAKGNA